jgi:hypothetical protein
VLAEREVKRVAKPRERHRALGEHVLVAIADLDAAPLGLRLAQALAEQRGGAVEAILLESHEAPEGERRGAIDRLSGMCHRIGIDADPRVRFTDHNERTAILSARDVHASLVIAVGDDDGGSWSETVALVLRAPVVIVRGAIDSPLSAVRLLAANDRDGAAGEIAADLLAAMPSKAERVFAASADEFIDALKQGDVAIAAVSGWDRLAGLQPPQGAALVLVPEGLLPDLAPAAMGSEWSAVS